MIISEKLSIAVVVQGRFHAFDLARELLSQGHEVFVFTNYPRYAVARFGFPQNRVRSFLLHGLLDRFFWTLYRWFACPYPERWMHESFGRWASKELMKDPWDILHVFSGVAEEIFDSSAIHCRLKTLVRGSAHIVTQSRILSDEADRTGRFVESPSAWMIAREKREYEKAERIIVLSTFALKSFLEQGVPEHKLMVIPLGAQISHFRPSERIIQERCRRVLSGDPLRVLMVGTFSFQKGAYDLCRIASEAGPRFSFRFVGAVDPSATSLRRGAKGITFVSKKDQFKLPLVYEWADLFIFTTLHDGYAVVIAQAQAAGLPVLTTGNSCGPDLLREGLTGWVLPIRSFQAFVDRLQWCETHREEVAKMVMEIYSHFIPRDWSHVAEDFVAQTHVCLNKKKEPISYA